MSSIVAQRPADTAANEAAGRDPQSRGSRALASYAAFALGFMVLVILEGAVVRATGSGAGCGDHWPLCNGVFFPQHPRLATIIEYTHRSLTAVLTTFIVVLIVWTLRACQRGDRARRAVGWCGVLLVTEALLGAVLVKGGYVQGNTSNARVVMQCVHFTNTLLLVSALTLTWWWLRERSRPATAPSPSQALLPNKTRGIAWLALGTTLVVGATGSVAALADTLFPSTSLRSALAQDFSASAPLLIRMRWLHPAAALVALVCAVWLCLRLRSTAARWVMALIAVQIALGVADVLLLAPVWMQVLHLLGADLYWIALVVTCAGVIAPRKRAQTIPPTPVNMELAS